MIKNIVNFKVFLEVSIPGVADNINCFFGYFLNSVNNRNSIFIELFYRKRNFIFDSLVTSIITGISIQTKQLLYFYISVSQEIFFFEIRVVEPYLAGP